MVWDDTATTETIYAREFQGTTVVSSGSFEIGGDSIFNQQSDTYQDEFVVADDLLTLEEIRLVRKQEFGLPVAPVGQRITQTGQGLNQSIGRIF